jgi:hypothetical protein
VISRSHEITPPGVKSHTPVKSYLIIPPGVKSQPPVKSHPRCVKSHAQRVFSREAVILHMSDVKSHGV